MPMEREGQAVLLHCMWCVGDFSEVSGPFQSQSAGGRWGPTEHSTQAGVSRPGTPSLPGAAALMLRAGGFLTSTSLALLSIVIKPSGLDLSQA